MNKLAFDIGVVDGLKLAAMLGKPVEGQTLSVGGVMKVFKDGRWQAPSTPSVASRFGDALKSMFGGGGAADNAPVVRAKGFNVAKARRMAMAAA